MVLRLLYRHTKKLAQNVFKLILRIKDPGRFIPKTPGQKERALQVTVSPNNTIAEG